MNQSGLLILAIMLIVVGAFIGLAVAERTLDDRDRRQAELQRRLNAERKRLVSMADELATQIHRMPVDHAGTNSIRSSRRRDGHQQLSD
jgi:uncharacterized membrane-anchored protein YhcB (DUF1043 family)